MCRCSRLCSRFPGLSVQDRLGRRALGDQSPPVSNQGAQDYQKTIVALKETMRLMEEIDGLIPRGLSNEALSSLAVVEAQVSQAAASGTTTL